jgi:autotransporter-associated beta strand protein
MREKFQGAATMVSQASLSSHPTTTRRTARRRASRRVLLLATSALVSLALPTMAARAANGTWVGTVNGDLNNAANWSPNTAVPDGDMTFGVSNQHTIIFTQGNSGSNFSFDSIAVTSDAYTFNANGHNISIDGAGLSAQSGASLTFTNTNIMSFNNSSSAGNANLVNNAGAALFFEEFAAVGGATATITNHGNLEFVSFSSAESASITSDGAGASIAIEDDATGGNAKINLIHSGSLNISNINGTSTTIGSLAGDATGVAFLGNKTLVVGGNNLSTVFAGVIADDGATDPGSLTKAVNGTLTLTGVNNTYLGATTVTGGTLIVDGSIASSSGVSVTTGGTLGGTGFVPGTVISGGTLAPGDGQGSGPGNFGQLKVQGNLTFTTPSTYLVQVSPTAAASTSVTGTAILGGATVAANFAPGSYVAKQYTILTAGSRNGTFGSIVTSNLSGLFQTTLSYDATDVFLNLSGSGKFLTSNVNQANVGNGIINSFTQTGSIPAAFALLSPTGLSQVSGETAVGTQQATFSAMNQFMGVLLDPTVGALSGARASDAFASMARKAPAEAFESRWGVWGAGFGGSQNTSGNAVVGSNNTASNIFGTAVGADYRFSPNTIAGFALAGGGTHFTVDNGGSGNSDLFQAGAYVRHTQGAVFLAAALAYGWQDVTTNRTVTAFGIDSLRADFKTNALSGRLEGGYKVATGIGDITPYAAGQFTTYRLPSYAEQTAFGANTFALNYNGKDVTATRTELGLRGETAVPLTDATLMLRGRLAWAHDFNTDRNIQATFQSLPGSAFVVNGATPAADTALTTLSAETLWRNGWSASITGDAQLSDSTHSYSGKGVVRYSW